MPLVSRDDLVAESHAYAGQSYAERSVARMEDPDAPMPPGGADLADTAVLRGWIDAGMPEGTCDLPVGGDPAFDGPSVCSRGVFSKAGEDTPSRYDMYPGRACNACHATGGDEGEVIVQFAAAGTVYPTGHEPNDCLGVDGSDASDVTVEITGADGTIHVLHPRPSGNFALLGALATPYTAKVVSSKGARVMSAPQTSGDCNLCHTDAGASGGGDATAPGRIVVPW